jgi:cytochrome c oxidase subunit 4
MGRYVAIWLALLVLTVVTVVTGRIDLGAANIWIAMAIATTKATLVVLFFMHLWDAGAMNRMIFVVSVVFVAVLMLGVFGDLMQRLSVTLPNGGPLPFTGAGAQPGAGASPGGH